MPLTKLSRATLTSLAPNVTRPGYNPSQISSGIVHLGFGGFHRAHMARYTHDLMEQDATHLQWGITGVGLLQGDRKMRDALIPQDSLYTLVERTAETDTATIIGSVSDVIFAEDSQTKLSAALNNPATRIVSLTVTENGYCIDRSTNQLDTSNPAIKHDLENPDSPRSIYGILHRAAQDRMTAKRPGFTALSCDNIQNNGHVLQSAFHTYLDHAAPHLRGWVQDHLTFPGTMVDRITPVTKPADLAMIATTFGIDDAWPVCCEKFRQWVIEDHFIAGRPAWEQVGAQFVADVAPYEFMKLRLLNASHLAVAGLGQLSGYHSMAETMADMKISAYMRALMDRETSQTLPTIPGIDLEGYKTSLIERFSNPKIEDTTQRVNTDAPLATLVDSAVDRLSRNQSIDCLALAIAAWLRRASGYDDNNTPIEVRHPMASILKERATQGGPDPRPLLSITPLFGELGHDPRFVEPVSHWLGKLYALKTQGTLEKARSDLQF